MTTELLAPPPGWEHVEATLGALRSSSTAFDEFFNQQLDELESLASSLEQRSRNLEHQRSELRRKQRELETERQKVEEYRRSVASDAQQLHEQRARLEATQTELEKARAEFDRLREAGPPDANTGTATEAVLSQLAAVEQERDELSRQIESINGQRQSLEQELAAARAQISRLSEATLELAHVRAELAEARAELLRQPERTNAEADAAAEQLCAQLADAEHQRTALENNLSESQKERALLEAELETVRRRVVELAETAAAEKQQTAAERAEWSKELKQMRKVLERQSAAPAAASRQAAAPAAQGRTTAESGDPMLESVMAQFDMLQKDIAKRRTGKKVNK